MVYFIFNILLKNIAVSTEKVLVKLLDYYNIKQNDCKLYGKKTFPFVLQEHIRKKEPGST